MAVTTQGPALSRTAVPWLRVTSRHHLLQRLTPHPPWAEVALRAGLFIKRGSGFGLSFKEEGLTFSETRPLLGVVTGIPRIASGLFSSPGVASPEEKGLSIAAT